MERIWQPCHDVLRASAVGIEQLEEPEAAPRIFIIICPCILTYHCSRSFFFTALIAV